METFYRVQDAEGIGPYQNNDNSIMLFSHVDFRHPTPRGYGMRVEDRSGFRNMQQLYRWFGGYLPGLLRNGYSVVKVTGTLKYSDPFQVVYEPER